MQNRECEDERIVEEIRMSLAKSFGVTASRAIDFYADTHIALADPEEYVVKLLSIFGRGTSCLLDAIVAGLASDFGFAPTEAMTLGDCIDALRTN